MINIKSSKQEAFRIREYAFFNENRSLGKIFTLRHFMAEKIRSGQTPIKITKAQLNKLKKAFDHKDNINQRQAANTLERQEMSNVPEVRPI
ncbi:hypothetical protein BpHYR1_021402 [Brachionus plicatilis]|uniref:Uncharacterized protein n=1 Tax=Brachionus plicatilis TaxID=10195 RepID=A0A3M7PZL4_BRAPC|nr:hypothetical protein BpHYR1_021402 [Brachionus plicatilis]